MSKFMKQEDRDNEIKGLMVTIRKNTESANCIDNFETLLKEIPDKDVVDTMILDMKHFAEDFLRLGHDVDNMANIDFIARILTREFIRPDRYFADSFRKARLYLMYNDILKEKYSNPVYEIEKGIVLPKVNALGTLEHKDKYTAHDVVTVSKHFGDISDLSVEEVHRRLEEARKVILIYDYMPAVVKAFIQTKRRSFNLDRNSKKFGQDK